MLDRSSAREAELKKLGYRSHIHCKVTREKPLSTAQKDANNRRSQIRARVEHIFGRQYAMGGKLLRSIGFVRIKANIGLKNIVYNMQRFILLEKPSRA